jgi:glutathione S-transferase
MQFFTSPSSPFGRKVKIGAHVLGFYDQLTEVPINTLDPESGICDVNPLGKIPALEDNGSTLYDSRVIMEYLDAKAGGGKIIPMGGAARFDALRRAALTDGILDAAVLVVYETRMRPKDKYVDTFVARQRDKIIRGLTAFAATAPSYQSGTTPDVGEIGLACVLDYLDFRKQVNWRDYSANLAGWLDDFAVAVPGYSESFPPND